MRLRDRRTTGACGRLAWGAVAVVSYLAAQLLVPPTPGGLLYDGLVPLPPYRWVHPPPARIQDNQPAQSGSAVLGFGPQGSPAVEVATGDNQALVTFPAGAVVPRADGAPVRVTITPLDPATLPAVSRDDRADGNAYRVEAVYQESSAPAALVKPVTVVIEYPVHAVRMLRLDGSQWMPLSSQRFPASQQVLAMTTRLGVFVPAADGP